VHAAETLARRRGYQQIGLGVDDHNHRAAALYLRLGYRETGCHRACTKSAATGNATTSQTRHGS
jgi:RimJ/RimL family protein N-acetyltransferase